MKKLERGGMTYYAREDVDCTKKQLRNLSGIQPANMRELDWPLANDRSEALQWDGKLLIRLQKMTLEQKTTS